MTLFERERHELATEWPISPIVAPPKTPPKTALITFAAQCQSPWALSW